MIKLIFGCLSRRPLSHNSSADPNILPTEMLEKILKFLNYKDLCQAELVCRRWKEIIKNLKKEVSGNYDDLKTKAGNHFM